jgi:hypothetical protein
MTMLMLASTIVMKQKEWPTHVWKRKMM